MLARYNARVRIRIITAAYVGLVAVLHLVYAAFPRPWNWGAHHAGFLPWYIGVSGAALAVVVLVVVARAPGTPFPAPRARYVLPAVLLLFAVLFWLLREHTHFLGDGYLWVEEIREGRFLWTNEPGALWLHYAVNRFLGSPDPALTFALVSALCGLAYVALSARFAESVSETGWGTVIVAGILVSSGITRLFYGYVETYSLLAAATLFYLVQGVRVLTGSGRVGVPLLIGAAVSGLHVTGLALVPSMVYLIRRRTGGRMSGRRFTLVLGAVLLLGAGFLFAVPATREFMLRYVPYATKLLPLREIDSLKIPYGLLGLDHVLDWFQEQLLVGPFGMPFVLLLLVAGGARNLGSVGRFLLWAGGPWMIASFLYNRELGAARDWDLFASASIPFLMLSGLLVERWRAPEGAGLRTSWVGAAVLAVTVGHTVPWVASGAREAWSRAHFEFLLGPGSTMAPFARMGDHLARSEALDGAVAAYGKAVAADPSRWRVAANLGHHLIQAGRVREGVEALEAAARVIPGNAIIAMNLAAGHRMLGDVNRALECYEQAIAADSMFVEAHLGYGELLLQVGRGGEAVRSLTGLIRRGRGGCTCSSCSGSGTSGWGIPRPREKPTSGVSGRDRRRSPGSPTSTWPGCSGRAANPLGPPGSSSSSCAITRSGRRPGLRETCWRRRRRVAGAPGVLTANLCYTDREDSFRARRGGSGCFVYSLRA